MKTYLIITILSFIQISVFSQQIEFFNVGIQDKPLPNAIVSIKKTFEGDFIKNVVVNKEIYNIIKQYVLNNNTYKQPVFGAYYKKKDTCFGSYDFGCYAVQIKEKCSNLLYFMDTNEKSLEYFKGLVALLNEKGHSDIAEAFQEMIVRIEIIEVPYDEE